MSPHVISQHPFSQRSSSHRPSAQRPIAKNQSTRRSAPQQDQVTVHVVSADRRPVPADLVERLEDCRRVRSVRVHRDQDLATSGNWPTGIRVLYAAAGLEEELGDLIESSQDLGDSPLILASDGPSLALTGFSLGAIDYLVSPWPQPRIEEAIARATEWSQPADQVVEGLLESLRAALDSGKSKDDMIVCRTTNTVHLVPVSEVRWIEGDRNYFKVHSDAGVVRKRGSLSRLEKKLPSQFRRVHRSAIINMEKVVRIDRFPNATGQAVLDDGSEVPISRGRRLLSIRPMLERSA